MTDTNDTDTARLLAILDEARQVAEEASPILLTALDRLPACQARRYISQAEERIQDALELLDLAESTVARLGTAEEGVSVTNQDEIVTVISGCHLSRACSDWWHPNVLRGRRGGEVT